MSTGGSCLQARYNQWMNERLYAVTSSLPEAVRRRDLGAFFKSLHGTFNHILLVDRLWIGRMTGHPCHFDSLDQELYRDFEQLRMQQRETDADLLHRVRALTAQQLTRRIDYISLMTGQPKRSSSAPCSRTCSTIRRTIAARSQPCSASSASISARRT
ncbi:MAG: DinB family protein [Pseudomonadota bacterium]